MNFKLKLVSRQRNDREPNGEVYKIFWFCVTLSALFFNLRHFRSGNDNLLFRSKLSLLYAFQANSNIGMFIVSEITENPTATYEILVS